MPSLKFRYGVYKDVSVPIIPLQVESDGWHEIWAYVDSGASYSILKVQEAERLDIDIYSGKEQMITVGDGSLIPVYLHKLNVRLGEHEFNAIIGFSDRLGIGFNILGRKDFFDRFVFCFDDYHKELSLTEIEKG